MVNVHSLAGIFNFDILNTIGDFLSLIANFFQSIGSFISSWFRDLLSMVRYLGAIGSLILGVENSSGLPILLFPTVVVQIFSLIISIVILYKVLGREG